MLRLRVQEVSVVGRMAERLGDVDVRSSTASAKAVEEEPLARRALGVGGRRETRPAAEYDDYIADEVGEVRLARPPPAEVGPNTSFGEEEVVEEMLRSMPSASAGPLEQSVLEQSTLGGVEDMTEEYEDDFDAEADDTYDDDFDDDEVADEVGDVKVGRGTPAKAAKPAAAYDDDIIEEEMAR